VGRFFIDTATGRVATQNQLIEAGLAAEDSPPPRPWLAVQGPGDASTLWYAVMRKRTRGVYIGTLTIRHGGHHAYLRREGWEEVAIDEIAAPRPGRR
jgi:hypothetical protein